MSYRFAQIAILSIVVIVASALLLRAGSLTPPPGPVAPTMKSLDLIEGRIAVQSLPGNSQAVHVIDAPGSYYLTEPIFGETGLSGILITADHVTLDLNGCALIGGPGSDRGVAVSGGGTRRNLRVFDGTIAEWGGAGLAAELTVISHGRFENLQVSDNGSAGIEAGNFGTVLNCKVYGNTNGIVGGQGTLIERCHASSNSEAGILVSAGLVRDCVTTLNQYCGVDGESSQVDGCLSTYNNIGVLAPGGNVVNCSVRHNQTGIQLSGGGRALNCDVQLNDGVGVLADAQAEIRGCYVRSLPTTQGIQVGNDSAVTRNFVHGASAVLATANGNVILENVVPTADVAVQTQEPGVAVVRNFVGGPVSLAPDTDAGPLGQAQGLASPWGNVEN